MRLSYMSRVSLALATINRTCWQSWVVVASNPNLQHNGAGCYFRLTLQTWPASSTRTSASEELYALPSLTA